jgi:hypothetical protein
MARFHILVVTLLLAIVVELGMVVAKLPTPAAQAQTSRLLPVVIVDPGMFDCPAFHTCAAVGSDGLKVSLR